MGKWPIWPPFPFRLRPLFIRIQPCHNTHSHIETHLLGEIRIEMLSKRKKKLKKKEWHYTFTRTHTQSQATMRGVVEWRRHCRMFDSPSREARKKNPSFKYFSKFSVESFVLWITDFVATGYCKHSRLSCPRYFRNSSFLIFLLILTCCLLLLSIALLLTPVVLGYVSLGYFHRSIETLVTIFKRSHTWMGTFHFREPRETPTRFR